MSNTLSWTASDLNWLRISAISLSSFLSCSDCIIFSGAPAQPSTNYVSDGSQDPAADDVRISHSAKHVSLVRSTRWIGLNPSIFIAQPTAKLDQQGPSRRRIGSNRP